MSIKDQFIQECLNLFRREDVKKEFKTLMQPLNRTSIARNLSLYISISDVRYLFVFYLF